MCGQNKISAVILAAGYSSRMGDFKPLMKLDGLTVIESAVGCFKRAGISDIMVVVGHRASEVIEVLDTMDAGYILNDQYQQGMFSSVIKGVGAIAGYSSGFFLLPGDMPLVKYSTIERIIEETRVNDHGIIYPAFLGKRGHPPYIASGYFSEILSSDISGNLHELLTRHESDSMDIELIDQAILMDIDTPEDFKETVRYLKHQNSPTSEECSAILLKYKTPLPVIKHGEAVAEISCRIAELLNNSGNIQLDIELIKSAALLHDIAREKPHHAEAGAEILRTLDYHDVADIIAVHMDMEFDSDMTKIDERAIVYLADKMVKEEMFVPLKERFDGSSVKFSGEPDAVSSISKRRDTAFEIVKKIEKIAGLSDLESVLHKVRSGT